jgi:hypothetical protein
MSERRKQRKWVYTKRDKSTGILHVKYGWKSIAHVAPLGNGSWFWFVSSDLLPAHNTIDRSTTFEAACIEAVDYCKDHLWKDTQHARARRWNRLYTEDLDVLRIIATRCTDRWVDGKLARHKDTVWLEDLPRRVVQKLKKHQMIITNRVSELGFLKLGYARDPNSVMREVFVKA